MASEMDPFSAAAHALGQDVIDVATTLVAAHIRARDMALASRTNDPDSWPRFGSTDPEVFARRVAADFLNAGWRPPSDDEVAIAAKRSRRDRAEYNAWLESLSEDDFARVSAHVGEHGSWPDDLRPPVEWFPLMP
jgi:hypothetical protein